LKLKLTVDGKSYEVEVDVIEPDAPRPGYVPPVGQARETAAAPGSLRASPAPPGSGGAPVVDESKVCRSPFAGVVTRLSVQTGQSIQINDELMVLEAMKMETVITAPIAGKVARIEANVGDAVQQGQVLIVFQ
jgi:methylmalonyl-CoA carboxyltransferase small subunit